MSGEIAYLERSADCGTTHFVRKQDLFRVLALLDEAARLIRDEMPSGDARDAFLYDYAQAGGRADAGRDGEVAL